jgi:ubiquinone/menaquinone biosynthesis C-methylase UbiE
MSRPYRWLAVGLVLFAGVTLGGERSGKGHPFSDVQYWAKIFDSPDRKEWQRPVVVTDYLAIEFGTTVADIGAGTGYFTVYLSAMVGDEGRVYAVDTEQAMLDHLKQRREINQKVVVPILAEPRDPKLPAGEIDLILIANTWHHIRDRSHYLPLLRRALNPGGRVVVIDYREGKLPVGPPPQEKVARANVIKEFKKAGWTLAGESVALPYQYMLTFSPPQG